MDILLQAARVGTEANALRRAAEAVNDWDAVRSQAARHGVEPLLYWRLKQCCLDAIPVGASAALQRAFHANAARNLMMAAELKTVVGWLEAEGIAAIAYKGPTLAAWAYGDVTLREFCDLDILVQPADKARAVSVLTRNGCRTKGSAGADELSGNCEIGLATPNGCDVDLHWAISAPYFPSFDTESTWTRVHHVDVAGTPLPTFGADDLFMCLAEHGARHCWSTLGLICDVANLIRVAPPTWSVVLADRRMPRMVHVAVLLSVDLLGAPVPAEVVDRSQRDAAAVRVARQAAQNLFVVDDVIAGRPAGAMMQLRMTTTVRDKARYIWRRGLEANQTDNDFMPLPAGLRPLLYLIRPFRVMGKILRRGLQPRV